MAGERPGGTGSAVRFEAVSKSFDGTSLVVRDVTLSVARGEFLTFLGPSGSGKTTSLMMLAGFEAPTRGEIYLNDQPVTAMPPHKRGLGFVFQNYALFPHMSVAENLAFPLEVRKVDRASIKAKVDRALAMVSLQGFEERRPAQLSGGQQQRVAVARALVFEPSIVLMDEPLGALDKRLREQLQLELRRIHRELGVTMIYVTHDQSEAMTLSDRIAVFNQGRIEQLADPASLYANPQTLFVASFIGENNAHEGRVMGREGEHVRVALDAGGTFLARAAAPLAPDTRVSLSVRPERLTPGEGPNTIRGRIEERIFLGDHARLVVAGPAGDRWVARVDPRVHGGADEGAEASFAFSPDDAQALAHS
ncbi:MAG: polyamine ABC transporter ATP-binding protein [Alphaproteobacteria bacterium]|nr:polyamine ABC transporter ATP-binding protein [Alphaproteobacteria bacterium]